MSHFTPLRIKNAQSASPCSKITPPLGGVINVQRCNSSRVQKYVYQRTIKKGLKLQQKQQKQHYKITEISLMTSEVIQCKQTILVRHKGQGIVCVN